MLVELISIGRLKESVREELTVSRVKFVLDF